MMKNISSQTIIGEGPGFKADAFVFLCGNPGCGGSGQPLEYGSICRTRGLSMNEKLAFASKTAQVTYYLCTCKGYVLI